MRLPITITVLLFFLSACIVIHEPPAAPAPQPMVTPPVENITPPAPQPVMNETPEVTVEENASEQGEYERPPAEAPSVAKFLNVFRTQVKNYQFTYKNDRWMVQGKTAKVIPFRTLQNVYGAPFVDTIYFDLTHRTAVGVCEGHEDTLKKQCASRKILGNPYTVPYAQFIIKLPEEWLTEYQNLYLTEATQPLLNTDREVVHLKYLTHTNTADLYFDPASGLPVAVIADGAEYHYEKLAKNQIRASEKMAAG